jgi:hypothetical protein
MHDTNKSRKSIVETIRHGDIDKEVIYYYKSGMLLIFSRYWNLVETRISIYEAQQITAKGRVHDLINSWKRERIFGTCLIETSVVDAHPKIPTGLGDDNKVGYPSRVVDLQNEVGVEQLFDFFTDEVLSLYTLLLRLLLDRTGIGVDLQMVLDHLPRDPGHL